MVEHQQKTFRKRQIKSAKDIEYNSKYENIFGLEIDK